MLQQLGSTGQIVGGRERVDAMEVDKRSQRLRLLCKPDDRIDARFSSSEDVLIG
jgi:hypothetical protein